MNELLEEITALTQIRKYLSETMGNPNWDRKIVNEMNNTLLLIDKKIVQLIQSSEFKDYVNYDNVKDVIKEAVKTNNIRSGIVNRKM